MACPWFEPSDSLPWHVWPGKYRPPLGRPYSGFCRAIPEETHEPQGDLLVLGCNVGYARAQCERVPETGPDAARFCLAASGHVRWALERGHVPERIGLAARGVPTGQGTVLDHQIEAYFEACAATVAPPG